jgi:hypothetical protein
MKLVMEIERYSPGQSASKKPGAPRIPYVKVSGIDRHGLPARAVLFNGRALAFNAEIARILGPEEVVDGKRLVVHLDGDWKTDTWTDDNGKEQRSRSFVVNAAEGEKAFQFLDGLNLEAARLRRDADVALTMAEKLRSQGNLAVAYEMVARFVANYAGKPLDLEAFLADAAADDREFGAVADNDIDFESDAAAHFALADAANGIVPEDSAEEELTVEQIEIEEREAAPQDNEPPISEPGPSVGGADEVQDFGPGEIGIVETAEPRSEEGSMEIDAAAEADVLDTPVDKPAAAAPAKSPFNSGSPFGAGGAPFANRPFTPPGASARPVPGAAAKPAPAAAARQEEKPAPVPASKPSFGGAPNFGSGPKFF